MFIRLVKRFHAILREPAFAALRRGKSHLVKVWWATQIRASRADLSRQSPATAEALAKAGSPKIAWTRLRWATSRQARLTERIPNEN
jgi:hypothetical protein